VIPDPVDVPGMPPPAGLYNHALMAPAGSRLVAIAGQLAVDDAGEPLPGGFEDQMRAVVGQLDRLLTGLGGDLRSVLKFTTYLVDPDDIAAFYDVRARLWPTWWPDGEGVPPNTLLVVQRLVRPEFRIEIEALAVVPEPDGGAS